MPAPSKLLTIGVIPDLMPVLPPRMQFMTPREAEIERRLTAIEERLQRQDAERASWERLKLIGLVLAA